MSKFYVLTATGYRLTDNPPNHDHWTYDWKEDTYYEESPVYTRKVEWLRKDKAKKNEDREDS